MTNAILLAIMLAIVALNVVAGPRGYRLLAEAGEVGRKTFYRRMLTAQLLQFASPPIVGLLPLGRMDAIMTRPHELRPVSAWLRVGGPAVDVDPFLAAIFVTAVLVSIPLGAFLSWRRHRK